MAEPREIHLTPRPLSLYEPFVGHSEIVRAEAIAEATREHLAGHSLWNINSTAQGGGVAELLRSLVAYARGAGVDVRWAIIDGPKDFFRLTKRLHNSLHGSSGDGSLLGEEARALYEAVSAANAAELAALIRPGDMVILHDPQTAGLAPPLMHHGVRVMWRCHVGHDRSADEVERAWAFLLPYLRDVPLLVFSRAAYVPPALRHDRIAIVPPTIDPLSAKNQWLDADTVRSILVHVGLLEGPPGPAQPLYTRDDGSPGRVDRCVDVLRLGRAPPQDAPLVVQVSRWDRLKDHLGVMEGFSHLLNHQETEAELVLAGPNVNAIVDDPEAAEVFNEIVVAWRALPHAQRQRVHLANLPTADVDENATIVNALQRRATVVVQKSLQEGFGLTTTEAMWKGRPVLASRVGGIQDQIEDGVSGLLLDDPTDLEAFADVLGRLLADPPLAARLGEAAALRVREQFLGFRSLIRYAELLREL